MANNRSPVSRSSGMLNTSMLPPPPIFKPTFIQMQRSNGSFSYSTNVGSTNPNLNSHNMSPSITSSNSNSNYLTSSFIPNEEYNNKLIQHSPSISPMTHYNDPPLPGSSSSQTSPQGLKGTKKRRRSSSVANKEELERKKKELKTQHSIIEKKRRIKMNREFEALKFMVPACRLNILGGYNENNFENSNMMHKLTILQSTVEYIKYLHLVIKLMKLQMLNPKETRSFFKNWLKKNDKLNFVDFDLDLQQYRNIDEEFDFDQLFMKTWKNDGDILEADLDPLSKEVKSILEDIDDDSSEDGFDDDDDDDDGEEDELKNRPANDIFPNSTTLQRHSFSMPSDSSIASLSKFSSQQLPTPLITPDLSQRSNLDTVRHSHVSSARSKSFSSLTDQHSNILQNDSLSSYRPPNRGKLTWNVPAQLPPISSSSRFPSHHYNQSPQRRNVATSISSQSVDGARFKLPLPAIVDSSIVSPTTDISDFSKSGSSSMGGSRSSPVQDSGLRDQQQHLNPAIHAISTANGTAVNQIAMPSSTKESSPATVDVNAASKMLMMLKGDNSKTSIESILN